MALGPYDTGDATVYIDADQAQYDWLFNDEGEHDGEPGEVEILIEDRVSIRGDLETVTALIEDITRSLQLAKGNR